MCRLFTLLGKWMLVIAMITAIGGHFMLLQSVAWTTMVISNVQHGNLGEALEKTFDGQHPCAICKSIRKARESEDKQQPSQISVAKLNLFHQARTIMRAPVLICWEQRPGDAFALQRPQRPLLQPPRLFVA
jgi:hypothetical protein